MARRIVIPNEFDPFDYQVEFMDHMNSHSRENPVRAMNIWPRRHGKDLTALHQLLVMAHDRPAVYWHALPSYEQARKSVWNAFRNDIGKRLMDNVFPQEIIRSPKGGWLPRAEMMVELYNGALIMFVGSDSMDSLVGTGPVGVNLSEFALCHPRSYDFIRPMLRENGGWATFLTTPRGRNHAYQLYQLFKKRIGEGKKRIFLSHLDVFTAGRYTRAEAQRMVEQDREEGMLEELIRQEWFTDFTAANVGSYWGDLLEQVELAGRMEAFDFGPDALFTFWDLGHADSTSIWVVKVVEGGFAYVAHHAASSRPMSYYFDKLEEWTEKRGFTYRKHYFPHDARAKTLQTGESIIEQAADRLGRSKVDIVPRLGLLDGIQAARYLLQQPGTRFHPDCAETEGLEALRHYGREYDDERKVFLLNPRHDWASHPADAFRYSAVMYRILKDRNELPKAPTVAKPNPHLVVKEATMNDLWQLAPRTGWRRA